MLPMNINSNYVGTVSTLMCKRLFFSTGKRTWRFRLYFFLFIIYSSRIIVCVAFCADMIRYQDKEVVSRSIMIG